MRNTILFRMIFTLAFFPLANSASSADVAVHVINGVIRVQGSSKNDRIGLHSENEVIRIFALDAATTINQQTEAIIRGGSKLSLAIDLGAGRDECQLENLDCNHLMILDGPKKDDSRDDISLKHVQVRGNLNVECGGGDDVLIVGFVEVGQSVQMKTGFGDDVAMLYSIVAPSMAVYFEEGEDLALAGELYLDQALFDGGSDSWKLGDILSRLKADRMIHLDTFEVSSFDVLAASFGFERELTFSEDVIDTPLESELEELAAALGY